MSLLAIVVTYRRPEALRVMLDALAGQSLLPDRLLVVDNDPDRSAAPVVAAASITPEYLPAGENLGPAGGIANGMTHLLSTARDDDWILLLDDDDPPYRDDLLERLFRTAIGASESRPDVAGVGAGGSLFDLRRARNRRLDDAEIEELTPVDVIAGNQFPLYRVAAIRRVGTFDPTLFFGFEELEFDLRLRQAGFELLADGALWLDKRARGGSRLTGVRVALDDPSWRRYYSLRNLLVILRRHGATGTAVRVALVRGIAKPILNLLRSPSSAIAHLRLNVRAIRDAWSGRLGLTVPPASGQP